jgi:7-carboxy-7-deazaguanine synthase
MSMTIDEVIAKAEPLTQDSHLVILSGGEPLAQVPPRLQTGKGSPSQDDPIGVLIYNLSIRGVQTHIETAGVRIPSKFVNDYVGRYVVSPKLATSGNEYAQRYVPDVLEYFARNLKADFKFVLTTPNDLVEIQQLAETHQIPSWRIWLMPEGTDAATIQERLPAVAAFALKYGYNVSSRLHVMIWGNERAR